MSISDSNRTDLKEFFYVDIDRVRSLLAQLQEGVVDAIKTESSHLYESRGGSLTGPSSKTDRREVSRSYQELLFVAFEQVASEKGWINDLAATTQDIHEWENGRVHAELREGQLIRLQCDVQVLDGTLFRERVGRFSKMADALISISGDPVPANTPAKQRKKVLDAAKAAVMGGISDDQLDAISSFVGAFVGDSVAIRFLPCGPDQLEYGFSGALLNRREYIQEEREHLFSRYGTTATSWTCLLQVAAIPVNPSDPHETSNEDPSASTLRQSGDINRAAMEKTAIDLLSLMERIGIVEGPRWPSISVTPLGVYRNIPRNQHQLGTVQDTGDV